jgi:hypothetical protein
VTASGRGPVRDENLAEEVRLVTSALQAGGLEPDGCAGCTFRTEKAILTPAPRAGEAQGTSGAALALAQRL